MWSNIAAGQSFPIHLNADKFVSITSYIANAAFRLKCLNLTLKTLVKIHTWYAHNFSLLQLTQLQMSTSKQAGEVPSDRLTSCPGGVTTPKWGVKTLMLPHIIK